MIYIDEFITFAYTRPWWDFQLVKVGCGKAGFTEDQIRPLFKDAPPNVIRPEGW
jgi:hypothetical protein